MKILVVEDDNTTAVDLSQTIGTSHYIVDTAQDGWTALELIRAYDYDLLVLDVVIPGLDGISLCRQLRQEKCQLPIMMLTARGEIGDRVLGLEAGADDYVVKPCDRAELIARVWALLRRRPATLAELLTWESLRVDPNTKNASYNGQPLHLTKKEYGLLELFLCHPQRIFSRGAILDCLWSPADSPGEWTVTTHIKGLRQKLQIAGMKIQPIETIYGLGYRLQAEPKTELPPQIKQENQSRSKAHQLIDALETFTVPNSTETAQQIEQLLQSLETREVQKLADLVEMVKQAVAVRSQL
jgi:DNA-binding response OmpR family regulator